MNNELDDAENESGDKIEVLETIDDAKTKKVTLSIRQGILKRIYLS